MFGAANILKSGYVGNRRLGQMRSIKVPTRPLVFLLSALLAVAGNLVPTAPQTAQASVPTPAFDLLASNYNATTGVWSDSSGNAFNATATAAGSKPTLANSPSAVVFNGTNQVVSNSTYAKSANQSYTMSVWFKTSSTGVKLMGLENAADTTATTASPILYVGTNGALNFGFWNTTAKVISSTATVNDGNWHNVVGTWDGTTLRLYLNGVLQGSNSTFGAEPALTGNWHIGGYKKSNYGSAGADGYFTGSIGEAALYTSALPATDVSTLVSYGLASYGSALTYSANGGIGSVPATSYELAGNKVTLPSGAGLTKANAEFAGWSIGGVTYQPGARYTVPNQPGLPVSISAVWGSANSCAPALTSSGDITTATFTSTSPCDWTVPSGVSTISYLLVGGGGGGAVSDAGAGGGAGGQYVEVKGASVTPGQSVNVQVGSGGAGAVETAIGIPLNGQDGGSTSFGTVIAGGGYGGHASELGANYSNTMGDGGRTLQAQSFSGTPGTATTAVNAGGTSGKSSTIRAYVCTYARIGGGGAGAGAAGHSYTESTAALAGAGGAGYTSNLNGLTYGGGGGSGSESVSAANGGSGGGGNGSLTMSALASWIAPTSGTNGLGGGGGGYGGQCSVAETYPGMTAGSGGSGTVVVMYRVNQVSMASTSANALVGDTYTPNATDNLGQTVTVSAGPSNVCTYSGGIVSFIDSGTCTVTGSQAAIGASPWLAANTFPAGVSATKIITVRRAQAALTLTSVSGTYGSSLTLAYSGGSGSGQVSYTIDSAGTAGCTQSPAGVLVASSAGTCLVTVSKADDGVYALTSSVSTTVTFAKKAQTVAIVSAAPINAKVAGTYAVSATVDSPLAVSVSVNPMTSAICSVTNLVVTFKGTGTCLIEASQAGNGNYLASNVATQSIAVGALAVTFVANNGTSASSSQAITTNGATALSSLTALGFTNTGSHFVGWNTKADGTGVSYTDQQSVTLADDLTVYAIWAQDNYTLTYASPLSTSGTVPTDSAVHHYNDVFAPVANPGALIRPGYTFAGWSLMANGSGTLYGYSGGSFNFPAGNTTLYAAWTPLTYTITYNANGATGAASRGGSSVQTDTYTSGASALTLPGQGTLTRTGYLWGGWATTANASVSDVNAQAFTTTSTSTAVTLYAVWTAKTIHVSFSQGSIGASGIIVPATAVGSYGTSITLSSATGRVTVAGNDYDFVSWSDGHTTFSAGSTYALPENDVTLTAVYVQVFAVQYTLNGGTSQAGESEVDLECTQGSNKCLDQQVITLNLAPTRDGYTFAGWSSNSGSPTLLGGGSSTTITANNYLFTAVWTPINYHVTYVTYAGATNVPVQTDKNIGGTFQTPATAPVRTGYNFVDWVDGNGNKFGPNATYTVQTSDVVLTAEWSAQHYSITFNWNGGTANQGAVATGTVDYTYGSGTIALPCSNSQVACDHSRDGYVFSGWALVDQGPTVAGNYSPTQSVELVAQWGNGSYSLTLDAGHGLIADGGTSVLSKGYTVATGASQVLPTPTRSNFHFVGWFTAASGGTQVALDGSGAFTPNMSQTLYAQWIQNSLWQVNYDPAELGSLTASSHDSSFIVYPNGSSDPTNSGVVTLVAGSLPTGTVAHVFGVLDNSYAQARLLSTLGSQSFYFLSNLVVSWLAQDFTVPSTASGKPVMLTINSPQIKAGAKVYTLLNGVATLAATATQDGHVQVNLTDDPEVVVVAVKPDAPTAPTAVAGDTTATVTWQAPASNGGSPVTDYLVTSSGGQTCTTTLLTCQVTGLTNGVSYTFTVQARNAIDLGDSSLASNAVTPVGPQTVAFTSVAQSPAVVGQTYQTQVTSTGTTAQVSVASGSSAVCSVLSGVVTFLTRGNCVLNLDAPASAAFTAANRQQQTITVIDRAAAPTSVQATAGNTDSNISWTASASDGGSAITGYVASVVGSVNLNCSSTGTSCVITGLTNGVSYIIQVQAQTSAGPGYASLPSSAVVPVGPQTVTITSTAPSNAKVGGNYQATATVTSGANPTWSIASASSAICSVSATGLVTFRAIGTCQVSATAAASAGFLAAAPVSQSFEIAA
ncbi:MAG: hypothetical protein RJA35_108, partial [Actinomycetota bacterium]